LHGCQPFALLRGDVRRELVFHAINYRVTHIEFGIEQRPIIMYGRTGNDDFGLVAVGKRGVKVV